SPRQAHPRAAPHHHRPQRRLHRHRLPPHVPHRRRAAPVRERQSLLGCRRDLPLVLPAGPHHPRGHHHRANRPPRPHQQRLDSKRRQAPPPPRTRRHGRRLQPPPPFHPLSRAPHPRALRGSRRLLHRL